MYNEVLKLMKQIWKQNSKLVMKCLQRQFCNMMHTCDYICTTSISILISWAYFIKTYSVDFLNQCDKTWDTNIESAYWWENVSLKTPP